MITFKLKMRRRTNPSLKDFCAIFQEKSSCNNRLGFIQKKQKGNP
jgi:hypothetical protein